MFLEVNSTEQSAATTGNGTVTDCTNNGEREHSWYIDAAGTISTGAIQIETARTAGYTGTWAPLAGPVTLVTETAAFVGYTGALMFTRARISTDVTGAGGSVTVQHIAK